MRSEHRDRAADLLGDRTLATTSHSRGALEISSMIISLQQAWYLSTVTIFPFLSNPAKRLRGYKRSTEQSEIEHCSLLPAAEQQLLRLVDLPGEERRPPRVGVVQYQELAVSLLDPFRCRRLANSEDQRRLLTGHLFLESAWLCKRVDYVIIKWRRRVDRCELRRGEKETCRETPVRSQTC